MFDREHFKARDHQAVEHHSYPGLHCKSATNGTERYSKCAVCQFSHEALQTTTAE